MKKIIMKVIKYLCYHSFFDWLPDKLYIIGLYYGTFGKKLDLKDPKDFNEKLQWLKLYGTKPEYTKLVDKYEVKKIVAKLIGDKYIIPTLGVWNSIEDVDFDLLPNQFVLKTTHDSGGVVICKDKNTFDFENAKKIIHESLHHNYYYTCREKQYKDIKPRVIAEKYIVTSPDEDLKDYKMMCFHGEFDNTMICEGRNTKRGVRFYHFDREWNFLPYVHYDDIDLGFLESMKPQNYKEMIEIAEKLCKGYPHIRVDLYNVNGEIYFGELTFYQSGGFDTDLTDEAKSLLGNKIIIQ